jgi:uncharacterized OB-fold protein
MQVPRYWRLQPQRYALLGEVCPSCHNPIFPPRPVCPHCRSEVSQVEFEQPAEQPIRVNSRSEVNLPVGRGD